MTLNLLPLYAASFAMVALLGVFAHHNKKAGWVKKRRSLFEELLELQAFAKEIEAPGGSKPEGVAGIDTGASSQGAVQFSTQLAGLSAGLRTSVKIGGTDGSTKNKVVEPEHVSA